MTKLLAFVKHQYQFTNPISGVCRAMNKMDIEHSFGNSPEGGLEALVPSEVNRNIDDELPLSELQDLQEVIKAKEKDPMRFVSGYDGDNDGVTPASEKPDTPGEQLLDAAEEGNIERVKELLEANADLIRYKDADGYTALHRACYEHHVEVASILISHGCEIDAACLQGWTPLHSASHWNAFRCVRVLLENGANVNAQTEGGLTPLHFACGNGNNRETIIILLTEPGINIDIVSKGHETAFQIARRSTKLYHLFDMFRPSIRKI